MWPFRRNNGKSAAVIQPPVDLSQPVKNAALVKAIAACATSITRETERELLAQLNSANYLMVTLDDEMDVAPSEIDGQVTIQKGSLLKSLCCADNDDNRQVALFTDWREIHAYTEQQVSTFVTPANDAWGFVLNPANNWIFRRREHVDMLREELSA